MASQDILDLDALLAPVSEESPAGADLRYDDALQATYHAARDARAQAGRREREAASSENPADFVSTPPEWQTLRELGPDVIATKSKHLEIAAWLTESLVRLDGFPGLRDGFRLVHGLVERYWDELYPRPDPEEGLEARVFPLAGLNGVEADGTLVAAIRRVPITKEGEYALWQHAQAMSLERLPAEEKQARINNGAVSVDGFKSAALGSGFEYYELLAADVDACLGAFVAMTAALDARCGQDSPPSSKIKATLTEIKELIGQVAPKRPQAAAAAEGGAQPAGAEHGGPPGSVASREQAFATLLEVAKFFERTEPHSPVSFALKQAVRWGQMSLPDLWAELISDKNKRQEVFRLIGVKDES